MTTPSLRSALVVLCVTLAATLFGSHAAVLTADDLLHSHSSSFSSSTFSSHRHLSEVHVLDRFHVTSHGQPLPHFHPMASSRHSFRTLDASSPTALPKYAHIPSATERVHSNGQRQPFPDRVELHLSAFDQDFHLPMRLMDGVFGDNTSIEVYNGEGELVELVAPLNSVYWHIGGASMGSDWTMAVLREDGRFHLLFQHDGETYQADPMEHFQQEMDASVFHTMAASSDRGMAIYRHRDLINKDMKKCGNNEKGHDHSHHDDDDEEQQQQPAFGSKASFSQASANATDSAGRRLLQLEVNDEMPTTANEATLTPFSIFTNGQPLSTPQRLSLTVVVDAGFYSLFGSVKDVQAAILSVIAASNVPLLMQLQTFVTVTAVSIYTTPDTTGQNPWNKPSYSTAVVPHACPGYSINQQLADLGNYRSSLHPEQGSAHHLFTNCWPSPGIVGESYIGWLCWPEQALSISSYNTPFWQTVVHEIGHTLGAYHTLTLGGIMDYYIDSRYPIGTGPYQFHPNNQAQIQDALGLVTYTQDPNTAPYCIIDYAVTCGNGVVEPGEQCDDTSACCTPQCKLATGAQCSGNTSCCTSSCQFHPTSTTCAGGTGFCVQGECALSSCPANLPFCGVDASTGGCRQSCASGSLCYSGWSYNLNVPDGTACNSNGGVCHSGTCSSASTSAPATASVIYTWTTGAWPSACPCSGVENRTVTCVGSDGVVYANSYCQASSAPAATQTCTIPSACYPYQWSYSQWGSCSASCDTGVQTRTATCMWETTPPVEADGQCGGLTESPLSQQCNTQACTYQYTIAQTWGACSQSCGGGTQTRTSPTTCWRYINSAWQQMDLSTCAAVLGYTVNDTQACDVQACDTYGWAYGSWGSCSATCAGGTQSRSATCMDFSTNTQAAAGNCSSVAAVTSQACNAQQCPSYAWQYGNWSTCSVTCGTGTVTRTASCYDSVFQQSYPTATCTAALGSPLTTSNCTQAPCYQGNYQWQYSAWATCSASCGGGNQTRQVACVDMNLFAVVSPSLCNPSTQPAALQSCGTASCDVYTWSTGAWSNCSASCGGGTQTRNVYCQNFWTHALSAPSTCSAFMTSPEPATSQSCNTQACGGAITPWPINGTFITQGYEVGMWRECDATCGGGLQTREVTCVNATACALYPTPEATQTCNAQPCPAYWSVGAWSTCSATCNGGWMQRTVGCVEDVAGVAVAVNGSQCVETQPSVVGQCNLFPCPQWQYGDWSACSAQCDYGVQTRTALCLSYEGTYLQAGQCAGQAQAALTQACSYRPCPHWHRAAWGECDSVCGGGNQTRQVTCRLPHDAQYEGQVVDPSLCPTSGANIGGDGPGAATEPTDAVPVTSQGCNPQACPAYYWQWAASSACSATCGGGSQQGSYLCHSGATRAVVDSTLCNADAVPAPPACNTAACTGYQWRLSAWSACNVTCGGGSQYRNASCVSSSGAVVDDTNCDSLPLPLYSQQCAIDTAVCYGTTSGQVNGVCQAGACVCRPGWSGVTCAAAPSISQVNSGAGGYPRGVPLGETLMVTWEDSGALPYVSVLLMKAGSADWPVGQYIAQHLVNYGGFDWTVGSQLSDLDGGNYSVRVWFNDEVWADSAVFTVEDPCGYVACGEHGQCSRGVCQCLPGFSGADCSVGPCAARKCNWAYAAECRDEDWFTYDAAGALTGALPVQCDCQQGWSGPLCATPPQCAGELTCKNGADVNLATVFIDWANVTQEHYCGSCKCSAHWVGADCGQCAINCANGGVVDTNCTQCVCPAGYYGSACQNRYYDFNLTVGGVERATALMADAVALARFERTAATDLAVAAGLSTLSTQVSIAVLNVSALSPSALELTVRFGMGSALSSSYDFGGSLVDASGDAAFAVSPAASTAESSTLAALARQALKAGARLPRDLPSAWAQFLSAFADADSQLYAGVVTGAIDPTARVTVVDPSGKDTPASPALPQSIFVRSQSSPPATASTGAASPPTHTSAQSAASSPSLAGLAALVALPVVAALVYLLWRARRQAMLAKSAFTLPSPIVRAADPFAASLPPVGGGGSASPLFPRLPSSGDLEMVSSAHSSEDAMEYLRRSISDSTVAYQLHRNASSPVPDVDALMGQDGCHIMYRSTSMDTLPTPPTLSPQVSSM